MDHLPEPWLRGPLPEIHPFLAPIFYSFQQAREDLANHTENLTDDEIWSTPSSVGFHIRHIAGSTDRLMTYLQARQLSDRQMAALREEDRPTGPDRDTLLADLHQTFLQAKSVIRALDPSTLAEPRTVGRLHLPTTVIGLLTHIAEHTQRHVGQAICAAKLAKVAYTTKR